MAPKPQLRAGIYDRESKANEKSIKDQNKINREAVEGNGWFLVDQYDDAVSASRFGTRARKDWPRLQADLDAGKLDVVVTFEPSRADRDLETWVAFVAKCRTRGVLIHLSGEDETMDPCKPSHWKRLIDGGVDAAMESEKTSMRTRRGVAEAAQAGGFHGGAPYGYTRRIIGERQTKHGPRPVKVQERDPERAAIVEEIFKRIARSEPVIAITADLNQRGVPVPGRSPRWLRSTVRAIATNVAYIGKREHGGGIYDGLWAGLVAVKLFNDAQAVLGDPKRRKTKPGKVKWLLSYLAAAPCGGRVHYVPGRANRPARYACVEDGCTSVPVDYADEFVLMHVVERVGRRDARAALVPNDLTARTVHDEIEAEIEVLQGRLAEAEESQMAGGISAAMLARLEKRYEEQIAALRERLRATAPASVPPALVDLLDTAEVGGEGDIRQHVDSMPIAALREVIEFLFGEITIGVATTRLSRWSSEEDRCAAVAERITFDRAGGTSAAATQRRRQSAAA